MLPLLVPAALVAATVALPARAAVLQTRLYRVESTVVAEGLDHPWSLAFLPDGSMLVTERAGRLRRLDAQGRLDPAPIRGVPTVVAEGQGGLFDVVLHPDFARNRLLYLSYAGGKRGASSTEVVRARLQGQALVDSRVIFRQHPRSATTHHYGGRLAFGLDGRLYLGLGDRGHDARRAQTRADHAGSVIRLNADGTLPPDNPWAGQAGWKAEKYTLGHRNIQGLAVHPVSGALWAHEHGPQGGDEINLIRPGRNYGWPVITYGRTYGAGLPIGEGTAKAGMEQPALKWVPSIAPSGLTFYQGTRFPRWQGQMLVGALKDAMVVRVRLENGRAVEEERLFQGAFGRIRDVRTGPDGSVYLLTDEAAGRLIRLQTAGAPGH